MGNTQWHLNYQKALTQMIHTFAHEGKLLLCGNGGSAADCGHIVGELAKGFRKKRPMPSAFLQEMKEPWAEKLQQGLPAMDLTVNGPLISAVSNDIDSCSVYAQQVVAYGKKGDILLGISTSGNAENVLRAMKTARALGLYTIALTGKTGGKLADHCDVLLNVEEEETYLVQQAHLIVYHQLCMDIEKAFFEE
ncbi:MAG: SIS domain-containing protein [Clostridiales bacterium]|nr:SIS domain-containing protein [Clostridiales bacterium]